VDGGKTPNINILPAFSLNGYIAIGACEGAVDGELYDNFIKDKVIPECTPFPGPRSVLIMDNAKIHVGEVRISMKLEVVLIIQEIHRLIRGANMRFEYLPLYSPDYNPIEFTFSIIKAVLKGKHQPNGNETPQQLAMHAMQTAMKVVTTHEGYS